MRGGAGKIMLVLYRGGLHSALGNTDIALTCLELLSAPCIFDQKGIKHTQR